MTLASDVHKMRGDLTAVATAVEHTTRAVDTHEEQISGARGLSATIQELADEIKSLRKAAYWVAGLIVAGSVTFAFSVLQLVG